MASDRRAPPTDLYRLNMLAAYLDHGLTDGTDRDVWLATASGAGP
jgi:hypothetical protein